MTDQQLVDVYAKRDQATGQPALGDATLIVGGETKVTFRAGYAQVPGHVAKLLQQRGDLNVVMPPDADVEAPAPEAPVDAAVEAAAAAQSEPLSDEQRAQRVEDAKAFLEQEGEDVPEVEPPEDDVEEPTDAEPESEEPADSTDAEPGDLPEGEVEKDADEPRERVVPAGFENKTGEGELRCLAKKRDGHQCANAAVENSNACSLLPHRVQLGEAEAA